MKIYTLKEILYPEQKERSHFLKTKEVLFPGYVFAPWIPMIETPLVSPDFNLYKFSEKMVNSKFYTTVRCTKLID